MRRLTLASSITGAVMVALDGTVLTVAQPTMQSDLHASFVAIQWTSTAYLIAVASLLVFAGRLGDRYGHRPVFAAGVLGFAVTSAGIGLAPAIGWVIGLRVAQGVFGALLQPATLGMLRAAYPPDKLALPIAIRTSAIGLAAAGGPVIGGALTTQLGWRAVFLLNVLPGLIIGLLALTTRDPVSRPVGPAGLDLPGAALLALGLLCLVHTLVAIPDTGATASTALGFVAVAVVGVGFGWRERRATSPLVPLRLLGSGPVSAALGVLLCATSAMFGALFVATYFLQDVVGLDPLHSGLRVLPLAAMMVLGAPASAILSRRYGARRTTTTAMALLAAGILNLSWLHEGSGVWSTGLCFLLLGAGFGPVMVTATAVIVHRAALDTAGVAGGLQQTAMNIGPALGVAAATMLTSLFVPGIGPHWTSVEFLGAMGPTLRVLALVALAGVLVASRLPARTAAEPPETATDIAAATAVTR